MAKLVVRNIGETVKAGLRARAKRHGRSMEEEVRAILRVAAQNEATSALPLGSWIAARFAGLGLTEDMPELRGEAAVPAEFGE
jgi:plasmid stability protein